jgi:hypothetical protein
MKEMAFVFILYSSELDRKQLLGQNIKDGRTCLEMFTQESLSNSVNVIQSTSTPVTITDPLFPCKVVEEFAKTNFKLSHKYSQGKKKNLFEKHQIVRFKI